MSSITGALAAALAAAMGLAVQVVTEAVHTSALWRTRTGVIVLVAIGGVVTALALTRMRRQTSALLALLVVVGA